MLEKATILNQRLDRLAEHRTKADETGWMSSQIANLHEALGTLRDQLHLARKVNSLVGSAQIDLTNIDAGFHAFKRRAEDDASYPSRESWRTAIASVRGTTSTIAVRTVDTWQTWSRARLAELPTDRIRLIGSEPRSRAEAQLHELRRMAEARAVELGHVGRFPLVLDELRALLDGTPAMSSDVASVLKLFDLLDTVTLHDLTDEHIDALRESGLDQRIVLRWKDA